MTTSVSGHRPNRSMPWAVMILFLAVLATTSVNGEGGMGGMGGSGRPTMPIGELRSTIHDLFNGLIGGQGRPDHLAQNESRSLVDQIKGFGNKIFNAVERLEQFLDINNITTGQAIELQRGNGSKNGTHFRMLDFGHQCRAAVMIVTNHSDAFTELNISLPERLPGFPDAAPKWVSDIISITRYDDNGTLVKNTSVRFDIECLSPQSIGICRFDDQSPNCTLIMNITLSTMPGFCTVTSSTTSSFVAFEATTCVGYGSTCAAANRAFFPNPATIQCPNNQCSLDVCCAPPPGAAADACEANINCTSCLGTSNCVWCGSRARCLLRRPAMVCPVTANTVIATSTEQCQISSFCPKFKTCHDCNKLGKPWSCGWCSTTAQCMDATGTCAAALTNGSGCEALSEEQRKTARYAIDDARAFIASLFGVDPQGRPDGLNRTEGKDLVDKIKAQGTQVIQSMARVEQFINVLAPPTDFIQRIANDSAEALNRTANATRRMKMISFGDLVSTAVLVAVDVLNATSELNVSVPSGLPGRRGAPKWVSDVLSITRFDDNGTIIKNTTIRFDIECTSPESIGICRFDDQNPNCTLILNITSSSTIGFCTVTSNTTSSFVAYDVTAAQNCVGNWTDTGACSVSCGSGAKTQTFIQTTVAANGGVDCAYANGSTQTVACTQAACPAPCVGGYVDTAACSATCGGGSKTQTYYITTPAASGGAACEAANLTTQTVTCNNVNCPQSPCNVLKNCRACAVYHTAECGWCAASGSCLMTTVSAGCTTSTGLTSNASLCSTTPAPPSNFTSVSDLRSSISTIFGINPNAAPDNLGTATAQTLVNKIKSNGNQLMNSADRFQEFVNVASGTLPTDYIQRTGSSGPKMLVKNFGGSCTAAVVAAVSLANAASELNITIPTTLPSGAAKWISDLLSITRYDDSGNLIKNTNVSFDIECNSTTGIAVCRFSSDAPSTCIVLNATNGAITASTTAGFCTVTSPTSAFLAYQVTTTTTTNPTCATFSSGSCPSGYHLISAPAAKTCASTTCTTSDCCAVNSAASGRMASMTGVILSVVIGLLAVLAL